MGASRKSLEPTLFRLKEGKEPDVLIGSQCQKCQRVFFPPREWCAACLGPSTREYVEDLFGGPGAFIGGDFKGGNLTRRLVTGLWERSGVGPENINLAIVHDPFTMAAMVDLESLGFCPEGEGGRFILEGNTRITGKIPINTDGGLLCKGAPDGSDRCIPGLRDNQATAR